MSTTIVYRYGLHAPHEGAERVLEQMRAAHAYRNALTEVERKRRAAVRAVELEAGDMPAAMRGLAEARDAREAASLAVTRHRAKTRKRDEPKDLREALKAARASEKEASRAFREIRARVKTEPAIVAARDAIGERAKEESKKVYRESGVYWGQRALVDEAAADAFASTPMYADGEAKDPRFARWLGEGRVGIQLIGGLSVAEAASCEDTRLRIRLPDARAWQLRADGTRDRSARRKYGSTAELSLRVGSDGRDPIWAKWVLDMDRPLPEGASIQFATVHRKGVGPFSEWYVTLTIKMAGEEPYARVGVGKPRVGGAVALDVGWRVMGEELRVARWRDERGASGEVTLSKDTLSALRLPNEIRSERDRGFDAARAKLKAWLASSTEAPEGLRLEAKDMHAWRNPGRLVSLWHKWGEWLGEHPQADRTAYDALTSWYWRDRHDWACESRARPRALRRRKEEYRVFSAKLASDYDVLVLEDFDKRSVAVKGKTEAEKAENETARANRVLACTSELCGALKNAARSRGRIYVEMPAADTTRTCGACGLVEKWDAAASVHHACSGCGAVWDQDDNAAAVLLARWQRERARDAAKAGGARGAEKASDGAGVAETRWQRVARLRKEKEARMAAAREAEARARARRGKGRWRSRGGKGE